MLRPSSKRSCPGYHGQAWPITGPDPLGLTHGVFKLRLAQRGAIRTCYLRHGTAHCRQKYSANEILAHQNMHKGKHKDEGTGSQLKVSDTQCLFC